jgi:NAD(P)-dependent dehydrogenase (short-subunit alcohol dehydrogenase family)
MTPPWAVQKVASLSPVKVHHFRGVSIERHYDGIGAAIMEITREQTDILNGARGAYLATCMRWIVEWGGVMGARRWGKPEEAAEVVATLALEGLPYTVGQPIRVDGGLLLQKY